MFALPYRILKARLEAIDGIPAVSWLNFQLDNDGIPVYQVPHVYLEFQPVDMSQYSERIQGTDLNFNVHLLTEFYEDGDAPVFDHDALADLIYLQLHHYEGKLSDLPENAGLPQAEDAIILNAIQRLQVAPDHEQSSAIVSIQSFTTKFWDISSRRSYQQFSPVQVQVSGR